MIFHGYIVIRTRKFIKYMKHTWYIIGNTMGKPVLQLYKPHFPCFKTNVGNLCPLRRWHGATQRAGSLSQQGGSEGWDALGGILSISTAFGGILGTSKNEETQKAPKMCKIFYLRWQSPNRNADCIWYTPIIRMNMCSFRYCSYQT